MNGQDTQVVLPLNGNSVLGKRIVAGLVGEVKQTQPVQSNDWGNQWDKDWDQGSGWTNGWNQNQSQKGDKDANSA